MKWVLVPQEKETTEKQRRMKRIGKMYQEVISVENLYAADAIAQRGKAKQPAVVNHMAQQDANLWELHKMLYDKTYRTSPYTVFKVYEPKEREVYRLPYFPDRVVHHAIMRVLEPVFVSTFTADTYSCIKGKGIHAASYAVRKALRDVDGTRYNELFKAKP